MCKAAGLKPPSEGLAMILLSDFILLAMLSVLVFLPGSWPSKWRHLRKYVFLIVFGMWLVSAGFLLAGFLQTAPFFNAVKSGNIERVKDLLSKKPSLIQARTFTFWGDDTALNLAARTGNSEMVRLLLKADADVNAADSGGITPLHDAAFFGNDLVAEILLKAGANVNAIGYRDKATPLCVAAIHGHLTMVKILLANGADINALDRDGKTPLQCAQDAHQTNVVAILSNPSLPKQSQP